MDAIAMSHSPEPIYQASRRCLALFDEYMADSSLASDSSLLVEELRGQFKTWAGYIGAFAVPMASLDARLASSDDIKNMVLDLLTMLRQNLMWARENQLGDESKGSKAEQQREEEEEEASLGIPAVKANIERLFILAVMIRRTARQTHDIGQKINDKQDSNSSCLLLLQHRYSSMRKSLLSHLVQSVHTRGAYLQYLQSHNRKLAHERERSSQTSKNTIKEETPQFDNGQTLVKLVDTSPKTELDTIPSILSPSTVMRQHNLAMRNVKQSPSLISTGSTVKDADGYELPYPPIPQRDSTTGRPMCTICSEPLSVIGLTERKWKAHVDEDLQPYVCISEQCSDPSKFFKRKKEWSEHMQTRHTIDWVQTIHTEIWQCDIDHSKSETFDQKDDFISHLKANHKQLTSSQVQGRARRNRKTATRDPFVCPLCECVPDDIEPFIQEKPYSKLTSHIGQHLKYISLLSLSYLDIDFGGGDSVAGSSSKSHGRKSGGTWRSRTRLTDELFSDIPETEVLDDRSYKIRDQVFQVDYLELDEDEDWDFVFIKLKRPETDWNLLRKGFGISSSPSPEPSSPASEDAARARRELDSWLGYSPNDCYEVALSKRLPGTCDWILDTLTFQNWLAADLSSEKKGLWINGPVGFGKTVLCARIVQHLLSLPNTLVGYFFFTFEIHAHRDPYMALRSWISQILWLHEVAFKIVRDTRESDSNSVATGTTIIKLITNLLHAIPGCILIADGLDECVSLNSGSESVCDFLRDTMQMVTGTKTRVVYVSRNEPYITEVLDPVRKNLAEYVISPQDVISDINAVCETVIDGKLPKKANESRQALYDSLSRRCEGSFLWLKMLDANLKVGKSIEELDRDLMSTPSGLRDLYDEYWARIARLAEPQKGRAFALLLWTTFALRPLTISEITEAALIQQYGALPWDQFSHLHDDGYIRTEVLDLCGHFLEIRDHDTNISPGHGTVHLTHFSIWEYLLARIPIPDWIPKTYWMLGTREQMYHTVLARACLQYISITKVWNDSPALPHVVLFRKYASTAWYKHHNSGLRSNKEVARLTESFLNKSNPNCHSWRALIDPDNPKPSPKGAKTAGPLYYVIQLGLLDVAACLITNENVNRKGKGGRSPLGIASAIGAVELVGQLLKNGAEPRARSKDPYSPLHAASENGYLEIAQLLIGRGADLEFPDEYGYRPIHTASEKGHVELVRLLQKEGANIMAKDNDRYTPLHFAAEKGHFEVVQLLLNCGADHSVSGAYGYTPLHMASKNGHFEVVQLLIDRGADVKARDSEGGTPLHLASENYHTRVVQLLIECDADPRAPYVDSTLTLHGAGVPPLQAEPPKPTTFETESDDIALIKANIVGVCHRVIGLEKTPATLLIFEFRITNMQIAKRLIACNITITFGDPDGGVFFCSDIGQIAPDGIFSLHKTSSMRDFTLSETAGIKRVSSEASSTNAGISWETDEVNEPEHLTRLSGTIDDDGAVIWSIEENSSTKSGIPSFLRTAVLLLQENSPPFKIPIQIYTLAGFCTDSEMERTAHMDSVDNLKRITVSTADPTQVALENFDQVDIAEFAEVTFATLLS
ncbi:ankyrin repeat domain-containing protein 52 [Fusarium austroafricanum]|uniref:protein S-acyltransferase n=1 Tax=Fusarium austroafricanum TaxID=2364996 RepID=A0A8H4NQ92_9HYPO|nr:ankyrin repeat domain-containing protein 52 [Fusarium austroafricanum]